MSCSQERERKLAVSCMLGQAASIQPSVSRGRAPVTLSLEVIECLRKCIINTSRASRLICLYHLVRVLIITRELLHSFERDGEIGLIRPDMYCVTHACWEDTVEVLRSGLLPGVFRLLTLLGAAFVGAYAQVLQHPSILAFAGDNTTPDTKQTQ